MIPRRSFEMSRPVQSALADRLSQGLASFLLLVCCCGCAPSTKPVPTEVRVSKLHDAPVRFYANGHEVAEVRLDEAPAWVFRAEGMLRGDVYVPPSITAQVLLPCGWKEVPVTLMYGVAWDVIRDDAKAGRQPSLPYEFTYIADFQSLPVLVDNRAGEESELRIGQATVRVPAHAATSLDSFVPQCMEGAVLRFNGVDIGKISKEDIAAVPNIQVLIDPTAKHCYNARSVFYGTFEDVLLTPGGFAQPKPTRLSGKHLYLLPQRPTDVFKPAPSSVDDHNAKRYELLDARCR